MATDLIKCCFADITHAMYVRCRIQGTATVIFHEKGETEKYKKVFFKDIIAVNPHLKRTIYTEDL
jgi:hypothetical protein